MSRQADMMSTTPAAARLFEDGRVLRRGCVPMSIELPPLSLFTFRMSPSNRFGHDWCDGFRSVTIEVEVD